MTTGRHINDLQKRTMGREFDPLFNVPVVIDVGHHEIHEGDVFCMAVNDDIASGQAIELLFTPPDSTKRFHFLWEYACTVEGNLTVIEGVTTVSGGTTETPVNHNRNSAKTSTSTESKSGNVATPLSYSGGSTIWEEHFGAGRVGSSGSRVNEWIAKSGVPTVFRLESETAGGEGWLSVVWYEHTDDDSGT